PAAATRAAAMTAVVTLLRGTPRKIMGARLSDAPPPRAIQSRVTQSRGATPRLRARGTSGRLRVLRADALLRANRRPRFRFGLFRFRFRFGLDHLRRRRRLWLGRRTLRFTRPSAPTAHHA